MRTNIDIDDSLMEGAMRAGHFKTKKDAVEAGLRLLSRQAAYKELLKWEGKLAWDGDEPPGPVMRAGGGTSAALLAMEPPAAPAGRKAATKSLVAKARRDRR